MNADSQNVSRRRRKGPPRRVPVVVNEPDRRPFLFGWGGQLTQRERDALKERIALFAGIGLALVVGIILAIGLVQDAIITPHNQAVANAKPIAQVGSYTIKAGFFKRFEDFQNKNLSAQLQNDQAQQQQLSADPKKNAVALQQVNAQIQQLQQQVTTIPTDSLNTLIDYQTLIQRANAAGIHYTKKDVDKAMTQLMHQEGGVRSFQTFVQNSGLSMDEIRMLITGDMLHTKVLNKLTKQVPSTTTEVHARHILVSTKNKALAQRILKQVEHGANFAALAKKYSIDKGSKVKGGDLGYFKYTDMVTPFAKAAFATPAGHYTLVKSQFGWHVIEVLGRKSVKQSSTDKQTAAAQAYQTFITKQKAYLHVQRYASPSALPTVATTPNPLSNTNQTVPQTAPQPVQTAVITTKPKASTSNGKSVPAAKVPAKSSGKKP